jgi:hypothetical protein
MEEGRGDDARPFWASKQPATENRHVVDQRVFWKRHILQQMIGVHHLLVDWDEALSFRAVL